MYMRITRIQAPPEEIERVISDFKERVMPAARAARGYAGSSLFVDRETGGAGGVTFWESAQALAASGPVATSTPIQAAESTGLKVVDVERFQIVLLDRAQPLTAPAYSRIDNGHTAPEQLDGFASFVRDEVVPALRTLEGYRSTAIGIDRTSGAVMVISTWETAEDRDASDPSFAAVLRRAAEFTLNPIRIDLYELAVVEFVQTESNE